MVLLLTALSLAGCQPGSSDSVGAPPSVEAHSKHRGITYEHAWGRRGRSHGYGSEASAQSLSRVQELGANWIAVTVFGFQSHPDATSFRWGGRRRDESDEGLRQVTEQARARGLRVMLKPHIWLRPPAWVGLIEPRNEVDFVAWFGAYREFILHYARLASALDIEAFCIGNELGGTTHRESEWRALITDVRAIYAGLLTYGAHTDEVESVSFWDALDSIGVSAYFPVANGPSPSRETMVKAWEPIRARLGRLAARWNRPVLFTELGYRSVDFAAQYPWKFDGTTPVNLQVQADAYTAFFDAMWSEPWLAGVYWWKWQSSLSDGGPEDDDYTPRGKPAEAVLQRYFSATD